MAGTDIRVLFRYNDWANRHLLRTAEAVPPEAFVAPAPFPHGGLSGTLGHLLAAERIWLLRCRDGLSPSALDGAGAVLSLSELRARWAEPAAELLAFVDGLSDDDLAAPVPYRNTRGEPFVNLLGHILLHLALHGMQHRAEAAAILTGLGASPGDIDLIRYLREHEPA